MASRARTTGKVGLTGLTPLVDTLFILLFALLALSDSRTAEPTELVRVQLPEVERGEEASGTAPSRVLLEIDADSTVRVGEDGRVVSSRDELDRALNERLGVTLPDDAVVEILADRDARHGVALELLQHLRLRGFGNVQLVAIGSTDTLGPFGGE